MRKIEARKVFFGMLALAMATLACSTLVSPVKAQTARIYLDPAEVYINEGTPAGYRFNVTAWVENFTAIEIGGAQIHLEYERDILNATRWFVPETDPNFFMPLPQSALPTPPTMERINLTSNYAYIELAVFKGGLPPVAPWGHGGIILIVEFETEIDVVTEYVTPLFINHEYTYLLNETAIEIPGVDKYDGSVYLLPEYGPIIALGFLMISTATLVALSKKKLLKKL
ncbi:MAG: hypothetical protein QHH24_03420 [Candidatus Bathyarchaeota archaeon]|nr:hypothetical protein [Candidatus Bathyarchaeota archaeon]